MTAEHARAAAERVARTAYGRLVALLAAPTGDLALAEDALADAFERALATWPRTGVPDNPQGWLLAVARNRLRDVWKSAAHRTSQPLDAATAWGADAVTPFDDLDPDAIPDDRLRLLFVCAHPAVDAAARTPLMLQTVLGLDAARIATALAVPAATMSQRLVRAKKKIRDARIPFTVPGRPAIPERLPTVLEAVYGCYAVGWTEEVAAADSLAAEAQYLAVTLAALLETEPEPWGLAALITLSLARAAGRGTQYVPLDRQDPASWDAALIAEGESYLSRATGPGPPGRFQLEAAIQAVHCDRAHTGVTDWNALRILYTALVAVEPSLGGRVALAAVTGRTAGPTAGLAALTELADADDRRTRTFQPFHAVRAELLARAGRHREAADAFTTAAALTVHRATRQHLLVRAAEERAPGQVTARP